MKSFVPPFTPVELDRFLSFDHSGTNETDSVGVRARERASSTGRRRKSGGVQIRIIRFDRPRTGMVRRLVLSLLARVRRLMRAAKDPSLAARVSSSAFHAGPCEEKTPNAPVRRLCAPPSSEPRRSRAAARAPRIASSSSLFVVVPSLSLFLSFISKGFSCSSACAQ